jgi:hypothetical protein
LLNETLNLKQTNRRHFSGSSELFKQDELETYVPGYVSNTAMTRRNFSLSEDTEQQLFSLSIPEQIILGASECISIPYYFPFHQIN